MAGTCASLAEEMAHAGVDVESVLVINVARLRPVESRCHLRAPVVNQLLVELSSSFKLFNLNPLISGVSLGNITGT